jgi:hypothetical protein
MAMSIMQAERKFFVFQKDFTWEVTSELINPTPAVVLHAFLPRGKIGSVLHTMISNNESRLKSDFILEIFSSAPRNHSHRNLISEITQEL